MPAGRCACGKPATVKQHIHYKYPRSEWLPEAVDPYYVHGGGRSIETCGSRFCERAALVACREQIIDSHVLSPRSWLPSGLSAEQMASLELEMSAA